MKTRIVYLALLAAISLNSPSFGSDTIGQFCKSKWPDDYQMQAHCVKQQSAAFTGMKRAYKIANDAAKKPNAYLVPMKIIRKCVSDWAGKTGTDWRMVRHCTVKQSEASLVLAERELRKIRAGVVHDPKVVKAREAAMRATFEASK